MRRELAEKRAHGFLQSEPKACLRSLLEQKEAHSEVEDGRLCFARRGRFASETLVVRNKHDTPIHVGVPATVSRMETSRKVFAVLVRADFRRLNRFMLTSRFAPKNAKTPGVLPGVAVATDS